MGEIPQEDVLRRALVEAEYQINRRPLTHAPIDHEDAKPLSPNMVLFGDEYDDSQSPGVFIEQDRFSKYAYRRAQHLANKYMIRWIKEYLPEITRRSKWRQNIKPVNEGDIVIVIEPNEVSQTWRRGRVTKTYPGSDGIVRTADVKMSDGTMKLKRSVGTLAVLDIVSGLQPPIESSDGPRNVVEQ